MSQTSWVAYSNREITVQPLTSLPFVVANVLVFADGILSITAFIVVTTKPPSWTTPCVAAGRFTPNFQAVGQGRAETL
jgi:hypothetical protein